MLILGISTHSMVISLGAPFYWQELLQQKQEQGGIEKVIPDLYKNRKLDEKLLNELANVKMVLTTYLQ